MNGRRMLSDVSGRRGRRGFTLIEMVVVLAILGILSALVTVRVLNRVGEARRQASLLQLQELATALDLFKADLGFYPGSDEGLAALVRPPASVRDSDRYPDGGYLTRGEVPMDSWGNEIAYLSPGRRGEPFELISYGDDGQPGGTGESEDIVLAGGAATSR